MLSSTDQLLLRQAIALAGESRRRGKHPFGAIVADAEGRIVSSAGNNSLPPQGDPTQHAELVAAEAAARVLSAAERAGSTLYASAEPCCMCAAAIYWCGIGRVVYALSERRLLALTGAHAENPTLSLPCRDVFATGQRAIEVHGPALEDEAAAIHADFWR